MLSSARKVRLVKTFFVPHVRTKSKVKAKQIKNMPSPVPVTERVLEYFDLYYRPTYKNLWPSIRISLLSTKKPAAVMNNFAESDSHQKFLMEKGAMDIIHLAINRQRKFLGKGNLNKTMVNVPEGTNRNGQFSDRVLDTYRLESKVSNHENSEKSSEPSSLLSESLRKDLHVYVSNKKLFYDTQRIEDEVTEEYHPKRQDIPVDKYSDRRVEYTALNNKVNIVKAKSLTLPENLRLLAFPPGDLTRFPAVRGDSQGLLNYYMIDCASVLPVIALDLEEGDNVLDLCASPAGKAISILQTGLPASLHCNDVSYSRTEKLRNFIKFCVPREKQAHVDITTNDGQDFHTPMYSKVLVDVPCNTDRHFVLTKENNLFSKDRAKERMQLTQTQKNLLVSGIKSCLPGGYIVYSTCTLAPGQNDGTVQQALDEILQTTDIQVIVEDLGEITDIFKDTFKFYKGCRFGKLVVPSLLSNFGPMYFARLKRLN